MEAGTSSTSQDTDDENENITLPGENSDDTGEEKLAPQKPEPPPKAKEKSPSLRSLLPGLQTALEKSTEALNRFAMTDLKEPTKGSSSDPKSSEKPPQSSGKVEPEAPIDPDPPKEQEKEGGVAPKVPETPAKRRRWI